MAWPRWLQRLAGRVRKPNAPAVATALGEPSGEPARTSDLPHIEPDAGLSADVRLARALANSVTGMAPSPDDEALLDTWVTRPTEFRRLERLVRVEFSRMAFYSLPERNYDRSPAALAAASCHPSGYVREAAVGGLVARCERPYQLAFCLIRCADWVEPVREAAGAAIMARLRQEGAPGADDGAARVYDDVWVLMLPLLDALMRCDRRGVAPLVSPLRLQLVSPRFRDALARATRSGDSGLRTACFAAGFDIDASDTWLATALDDSDFRVRRWAARRLRWEGDGKETLAR